MATNQKIDEISKNIKSDIVMVIDDPSYHRWSWETQIEAVGNGVDYYWTLYGYPPMTMSKYGMSSTATVIDGGMVESRKMAQWKARIAKRKAIKSVKSGKVWNDKSMKWVKMI